MTGTGGSVRDRPHTGEPPDGDHGWYVYAVVRWPDMAPGTDTPEPPAGIDGRPVVAIRSDGLLALASDLPLGPLHAVRPDAPDLTEQGWLARAARAHDEVLRAAFDRGTVLPFRFGCVYRDRDELRHALASGRRELHAELDRLDGLAEWTVHVRTTPEPSDDPAPRDTARADGTSYLYARRDRERRRAAARARRCHLLTSVADELARPATDVLVLPAPGGTDGAPSWRASHLVDRGHPDDFLAALHAAVERCAASGAQIAVRGPLPPFHFTRTPDRAR